MRPQLQEPLCDREPACVTPPLRPCAGGAAPLPPGFLEDFGARFADEGLSDVVAPMGGCGARVAGRTWWLPSVGAVPGWRVVRGGRRHPAAGQAAWQMCTVPPSPPAVQHHAQTPQPAIHLPASSRLLLPPVRLCSGRADAARRQGLPAGRLHRWVGEGGWGGVGGGRAGGLPVWWA